MHRTVEKDVEDSIGDILAESSYKENRFFANMIHVERKGVVS